MLSTLRTVPSRKQLWIFTVSQDLNQTLKVVLPPSCLFRLPFLETVSFFFLHVQHYTDVFFLTSFPSYLITIPPKFLFFSNFPQCTHGLLNYKFCLDIVLNLHFIYNGVLYYFG